MLQKYFKSVSILFVVTVFFFSNCGDKKDECSNPTVVGLWEMSSSSTEIFINGSTYADYLVATFDYTQEEAELTASAYTPDLDWSINFKDDKTYVQTFEEGQYSGTWSLENNGKEILMDKNSDYELRMEIIALSKDALLVTFTEGGLSDLDEDGEFETYEIITSLAFSK